MIILDHLCKAYNKGLPNEVKALDDVSLKIDDGELLAITGKSGAGKSTLLNILACLDFPTSGTASLDGIAFSSQNEALRAEFRRTKFGIVTQTPFLIEEISSVENVKVAFYLLKTKKEDRNVRAANLLKSVGLEDKINQKVKTLSGGEKQRVAIARALVGNPSVILADEPTGNLDTENAEVIFNILKNLSKSGLTVIIVTHDRDMAEKCNRAVEIQNGKIISDVMHLL